MSTHNLNYPALRAFVGVAAEYCAFIESFENGRPEELYTTLEMMLSKIHVGILPVVAVVADEENLELEKLGMTHGEWGVIAKLIQAITAEESDGLSQWHDDLRGTSKSGDDYCMIRAGMLWDDLADIYRDLHDGLVLWRMGTTESQIEASWKWRFGYESHWGYHLARAMQSVHEIRYQLNDD